MAADDTGSPTTQEIRRHLNEVVSRLEAMTTRLNTEFVSKAVFDEYKRLQDEIHKNLRGDVEDLQSDKTWLIRVVGAVIVTALLALIFVTNQAGAK